MLRYLFPILKSNDCSLNEAVLNVVCLVGCPLDNCNKGPIWKMLRYRFSVLCSRMQFNDATIIVMSVR